MRPSRLGALAPSSSCAASLTAEVKTASQLALDLPTRQRVERFGRPALIEQFDSLPIEDFQQEFEGKFVDETFRVSLYERILPSTNDEPVLYDEPTSVRAPEGRIVAGFDVGRTRDRSELAVFEEIEGRFTAGMLRSFEGVPFAEQGAELRRLLGMVPVARLSIDRSGIGMNLAENLSRDFPQVVCENFTNESKERWATDFKRLLQRRDVTLTPRSRAGRPGPRHQAARAPFGQGQLRRRAQRTRPRRHVLGGGAGVPAGAPADRSVHRRDRRAGPGVTSPKPQDMG